MFFWKDPTITRYSGKVAYNIFWDESEGFNPSPKDENYWAKRGYRIIDILYSGYQLNYAMDLKIIHYTYRVEKL